MASIFVVDDEPELRDLLQEALENHGHEVQAFPDGPTFFEAIEEGAPDAVLLDINMPGMSGWDVKERLSQDASTEKIPVIAVTARGGPSIERSARRGLGFVEFVQKPFRLDELTTAVDAVLEDPP